MKKILIGILCVMLISSLLVGCSGGDEQNDVEDSGQSEEPSSEEIYTVGVLMSQNADTFIQKITDGIVAQAEKYPEIEILMNDAEGDTNTQISQCETLIAQQVDAIILNAIDAEGSNPIVEMCNEADIPLIECNRLTTNENYTVYVGSDDIDAGRMQGEYLKEILPDDAKVCYMMGPMGISPQIKRKEGIEEALFSVTNIEVLQEQTANWKREEALALAEDWLTRYQDLDAIICQNDDMAMGALEAVEAAGRSDQVIVVGIDAIEDAVQAVKDGRLAATIYQDAAGQGGTAVDLAAKLVKGEEVDRKYIIPFELVTKDNVDEYIK